MKKSKEITIILVLIFLFSLLSTGTDCGLKKVQAATTLNNPRIIADSSMQAGQKVTWDCVWFGAYPQSEVTSGDMYNKLKNATGWDENNDIVINGSKYRRLKGEDATHYKTTADTGFYNWNNDYTTYHYFKYEPIKWRVLEVKDGRALLLSDQTLDDQRYNENYTSVTWETSSIRSWLNGQGAVFNQPGIDYSKKNFINTTFFENEQKAVFATNVENNNNSCYGSVGGNNTLDKVFLLAESQVYTEKAKEYGFTVEKADYDEARGSQCSSYAFAMGGWIETRNYFYKGQIAWWLRSPGRGSMNAAKVSKCNFVSVDGDGVIDSGCGVRPALYLNLSFSSVYSYAGTVCSDGTVNEKIAPNRVYGDNTSSGSSSENTSNNTGSNNTTGNTNSNKNNTATNPSNGATAAEKSTRRVLLPVEKMTGTLKSVKSPKKSTLMITWKKLGKITGYQVQFCAKRNFKKGTIERKFKKKVTKTQVGPLKSKRKYYVRMRPYTKSSSKMYYGKWSKVKKVKIK